MSQTWPICLARGIGVALTMACQQLPPPPSLPMVSSTLEINMDPDAATAMAPYLADSLTFLVNDPFQGAAMVDFRWLPGNWSLPSPSTPDESWWSTSSVEQYRSYARNHGTSGGEFNIQFHAFFIGHLSTNSVSSCGTLEYGVTIHGLDNKYLWDPQDRATFMFLDDIEDVLDACAAIGGGFFGADQRVNALVGMIGHELGHQRAGLTHSDDPAYWQFHDPDYSLTDIMRGYQTVLELAAARYRPFCTTVEQPPPEGDERSCRGVLIKNREVL